MWSVLGLFEGQRLVGKIKSIRIGMVKEDNSRTFLYVNCCELEPTSSVGYGIHLSNFSNSVKPGWPRS